jgi:ribose 1,5-bisphosphokinase
MAISRGELFYLMGPSGSGKDALIRSARGWIRPEAPIGFAHRYITRPVEIEGENHIAVTEIEFERLLHHGCLAMHWAGNGLRYGIGVEIYYWLRNGLNVVINGSREYFNEAARAHPGLIPIFVHAPEEVLRERLLRRGRESLEEVEQRLVRAGKFTELIQHPGMMVINNAGSVEEASRRLARFIISRASDRNLEAP